MKKKEKKAKGEVPQEELSEQDKVKRDYAKAVQTCRDNRNSQTVSAMLRAYANAKEAGVPDSDLYNIVSEIDKKRKKRQK